MGATAAETRITELEAALAAERAALAHERAQVAKLTEERDLLRSSHERLRLELELLKRRIFVAKAERVDTAQLELEFAAKLAALDRLGGGPPPGVGGGDRPASAKHKPTGRRDLRNVSATS
jgi:transposase